MTETASPQHAHYDSHFIVEDVVSALTGAADPREHYEGGDLGQQLERAASEFDKRTALAFCKALLDSLTEDPGNLRQLEALLILGLAHPDVLEKHRISLAVEGRRLAVLLERSGQVERARSVLELLSSHMPKERTIDHELAGILRRSGNTEELVERYLRRAERSVEEGNVSEAIPWLQEILLLDRTRRDVARMIRDLRYQEAERIARSSRRNRVLIVVVLLSMAITALVGREYKIREEFDSILVATEASPQTLYQRKEAIEGMIEKHRFWLGLFTATGERDQLRQRIAEHEREAARRSKASEAERVRRQELADAARMRGLMNSERGNYARALADFEKALYLTDETWEHRAQVEWDAQALRQFIEEEDGK